MKLSDTSQSAFNAALQRYERYQERELDRDDHFYDAGEPDFEEEFDRYMERTFPSMFRVR